VKSKSNPEIWEGNQLNYMTCSQQFCLINDYTIKSKIIYLYIQQYYVCCTRHSFNV